MLYTLIFFLIIFAAALTFYIWLGTPHGKKWRRDL